jgi:hypothetical protein
MADPPVASCRRGAAQMACFLDADGASVAYGTCHEAGLGPSWQACASAPGDEPGTIVFQATPAGDQRLHGAFAVLA